MENSPSSSSNGSSAQPPAFFRLSSEVTEKPDPFEEGFDCQLVAEPEPAYVGDNRPVVLPNSPSSAGSKSDNEGENEHLSPQRVCGPTVLNLAPLPNLCVYSPGLSSDAEQGDVDEGFDEEFEEREEREVPEISGPKYFELGDLDPKELQNLLEDTQLPNVEDFDLGVDVLDESIRVPDHYMPHPPTSPYHPPTSPHYPPSSPFPSSPYHTPNSPYHMTSASPAMEQLNINQLYNDYNLNDSFVEDPPSVQSDVSALTSSSHATDELLLAPDSTTDAFPVSTSNSYVQPAEPQRSPSPFYQPHSSPHSYQQQASPVLTTAARGSLDLAEAGNFLSTDTLMELSAALSTDMDTQSMYMFGNGTAQLNLLPQAQQAGSVGGATAEVVTLLDSNMLSSHSQASQTHSHRSNLQATTQPSLRTAPPQALGLNANRHTHSPSPSPSPKPEVSKEDGQLVEMPYYQFRKMLDDPNISEKRKEEVKNIRRRGRNKTAAKLCRSKKLQLIMGLEQEVEQLRRTKSLISVRTQSLEREIAELKRRCHTRVGTVS